MKHNRKDMNMMEELDKVESFNVEKLDNGWVLNVSGYVIDENDYTDYRNIRMVYMDADLLKEDLTSLVR